SWRGSFRRSSSSRSTSRSRAAGPCSTRCSTPSVGPARVCVARPCTRAFMVEVESKDSDELFDGPRRGLLARVEDLALGGALAFSGTAPRSLVELLVRVLARVAHLVDGRRNRAARV